MPLKDFFQQQIDALKLFLDAPGQHLRVLQHEPDTLHLVRKVLVGLDDDPQCPHLLVATAQPFDDAEQWCGAVLAELSTANEGFREALASQRVALPRAPADDGSPAAGRLARYVSAVADALPDHAGAYTVIVDPPQVSDDAGFFAAVSALVQAFTADWAKLLVLDRRREPRLEGIEQQHPRASVQVFHMDPAEIEAQAKRDLAADRALDPLQRRQYTAMLGAFAFARHDHAEAAQHQQQVTQMAEQEGTPAEQANAHYNLGNTYLAQQELALAEEHLTRAGEIAMEHDVDLLLAMALCNLGVTLHHQGRADEALQSLDTSRQTFKVADNRPGEAHALDTKAAALAQLERNEEAEQAWLEALALYEGITSNVLGDVRDSGRADIQGKLKRFYESTGQASKAAGVVS